MRACGECSACCTAFDVGALEKPAGVRCPHQRAGACAIYPARPDACRAFVCGWLMDAACSEDERPDRLGVIIVRADQDSAFAGSAGAPLLVAYELRPGALESPDAAPLLERLARDCPVALVHHGWEHRDRDQPSGFVREPVRS